MIDYEEPKMMNTESTLYMLAELWANKEWRDYITNRRNLNIKSLKTIRTGTIEGDALELAHKNGRITEDDELIGQMKRAYEDVQKLKTRRINEN